MNNSAFGKTMEKIRNRVDVRLVNERKNAKKLTMVIFFPNMEKIKNFFSLILILSAMKLKQKIFMWIFQMTLKKVLT